MQYLAHHLHLPESAETCFALVLNDCFLHAEIDVELISPALLFPKSDAKNDSYTIAADDSVRPSPLGKH